MIDEVNFWRFAMSRVVLDDETLDKLQQFEKQIEIFDQAGILRGYCIPVDAHLHGVDLPGPDPFSDEQAAEMLRDPQEGITTAKLLRKLRSL